MNIKKIDISIEELTSTIDDIIFNRLKESAISTAKKAYAPYSHFYVGASVLLENDVIISGCNQENAAYSSCLCAERIALSTAHSQYPDKKITHVFLCAIHNNNIADYVTPCGECRQVLIEKEEAQQSNITIIMYGKTETYMADSVKKLLPLNFGKENLKKK